MPFAHSKNSEGVRHDLVTHLSAVARLAADFGEALFARQVAYYAGLWHDVGKFPQPFQQYLQACEASPNAKLRGPDHKAAGAKLAVEHMGRAALVIQGHHGGLKSVEEFRNWLNSRKNDPDVYEALAKAASALRDLEPDGRVFLPPHVERDPLAAEFFVRMLFSALVDADYLDAEHHFQPSRSVAREQWTTLESLWSHFEADQVRISGCLSDPLNRARHEIYEACLAAAEQSPGLFRLSVPTGVGKTRSAMGFALRHALRHGLRRVVVAVPFISITEQTASIYRQIFGDDAVLEHHSAARPAENDGCDFHNAAVWPKLAADTVQLFESLFANSTSHTRKLHRLAQSVIVLDEAQALPARLLTPILDDLRQLSEHYGATVVISTATQPYRCGSSAIRNNTNFAPFS